MKTVAVLQSNYIPWKGYFDIIHDIDLFVFYDDVQFTKNDWRNRNKIKTPRGAEWLSIPVGIGLNRMVCEVELPDPTWQQRHWDVIRQNYRKAPYFEVCRQFFEEVFLGRPWRNLSALNQHLIQSIARDLLGIRVEFADSRSFAAEGRRQQRLIHLLQQTGADAYVSGPAAKNYIDPTAFEAAGIALVYKDYAGYPEYPQAHPPFEHGVSIIDLLFNVGLAAPDFIWGWRSGAAKG